MQDDESPPLGPSLHTMYVGRKTLALRLLSVPHAAGDLPLSHPVHCAPPFTGSGAGGSTAVNHTTYSLQKAVQQR